MEPQKVCYKKTKYAKFFEKQTFLTHWYTHASQKKQDVNWTYVRRSEDVLDVFWTSYVRSIYVLCLLGCSFFEKSSGGKKCSFFERLGLFCFLVTPVLRFALLSYFWRYIFHSLYLSWFEIFLFTSVFDFLTPSHYVRGRH